MKIIIVGAGVVGFHLAMELAEEGYDVALVDRDKELIREAREKLDLLAVTGDGSSPSVLSEAGIDESEMIIAVTTSDATNALICLLASKFGVRKKIARIRRDDWFRSSLLSPSELAIDRVVEPDRAVVRYVREVVETPSLVDVADFEETNISLFGFRVLPETSIRGMKMAEINERFSSDPFTFATLYRGNTMIVPQPGEEVKEGDICYLLAGRDMLPFILPVFQKETSPIRSVVVFGGDHTGLLIARELENFVPSVELVEPNKERAVHASELLSKARVIYGDPRESVVLDEMDLPAVDCFISAYGEPDSNILAALFMKKRGVGKVMLITGETEYLPVLNAVGLDVVINPKLIIAGEILSHIRRGRVHSVVKLKTEGIEMVEMEISAGSKPAGKRLSEVVFPEGVLLAAMVREGEVFIPTGETVLHGNQEVIVVTTTEAVPRAEKFFS